MSLQLAPVRDDDLAAVRAVLHDPALAGEFEAFLEPGHLEHKLADALRDRDATLLARAEGEPAGVCITFLLPRAEGGAWAALRMGVAERFRRRGVASALLAAVRSDLERRPIAGGLREIGMGAWRPNREAGAFAARHGFRHVRLLWQMERAVAGSARPSWPPGVTLRVFDGGEAALADWNQAYNASFAEHYHFVPITLEIARQIASAPLFQRDSLGLAYREGRCVGFCRNERVGKEAEIGVLGVVPEARGIGLGRALLRWGVDWFGARGEERVMLRVDGENEKALALYRSEGFTVSRTRDRGAVVPGEETTAALSGRESRTAAGTTPPPAGRP
jgi:mycothiol synthase